MTKDVRNSFDKCGRNYSMEEWERWDEDLVEEFGQWLALVVKAFIAVLMLAVLIGLGTWLWTWF